MKIVYPKTLSAEENSAIEKTALCCGILPETARLLFDRGVIGEKSVRRFLSAGKKWFLDPFDLFGMKAATERIRLARERKERVLVFGDYDADGICATVILCGCLKIYGIDPINAIPEREDGYGLNVDKIESIDAESKVDLIITVDCGISDAEKIERLKKAGIDFIVTDHHEPPAVLPDCICVNPKIKGQEYGFDGLCGGGVAYKLGYALIGEKAGAFLDLAAIATVADSMDLIGENRDIVIEGLKLINNRPRAAIKAFLGDGAKEITAQTIAYAVAPRINAGGRMGDAGAALRLFSAEREDEIFDLAVKLNVYNASRQSLCEDAFAAAKKIVAETGANADRVVIVRGDGFRTGVIGIVAAKLVETYCKPVIVFAKTDGFYKGSARSVEGVNIYDAISAAGEYLVAFGGHSQAAGVSVTEENFLPFKRAVNAYAEKFFPEEFTEKTVFVDIKAEKEISLRFAQEIEKLEPFGTCNRRPIFATEVNSVEMTPIKAGSPHYSFRTDVIEMLDFNGAGDVDVMSYPVRKTLIFDLNLSTFRERTSLKGFLREISCDYGDFSALDVQTFLRELKRRDGKALAPEITDTVVEKGYGTVYVVSDVLTLGKFAREGLAIYPFAVGDDSGRNCVAISPDFVSDPYERVIYLDEPIFWRDFGGRARRIEKPLGKIYADLSVERETFEMNFGTCSENAGKRYNDFIADCTRGKTEKETRRFLFCFAVFCELGFFKVKNGAVSRDYGAKKPLTDSGLYVAVREKLCLT